MRPPLRAAAQQRDQSTDKNHRGNAPSVTWDELSGIDADGPGWVSQTQALEQECQLRNAPVEYLEALPWVTRGGQRWIHQDTLREWCGGDGVFADRPRLCCKIGKTATGAIGGDGD